MADYVNDVRHTVGMLCSKSMLIGHSMGCTVVQKYLEKRNAPAAVLI
jgi:predicted alpha/beta hydrolase family esterase